MTSTLSGPVQGQLPGPLSRLIRGLSRDPVRPDLPARSAPGRRVRHQVRDGVAVAAFSAAASGGVAVALLLLGHLAG
jgi:hypothetical protein